jgi:uncharacterized membrane protein
MSFRDELESQSEAWVDEGLISGEQRQAILARTPEAESAWSSRLVPGLAIFGAVVVVLGLILVVSANWDEIPLGVKLVGGVALLAAVQATGYWVAFGPLSRRNTGIAIMLVGAGILLADLALVAQQYNVEENPSRLILVAWLLGLAALPYLFHSRVFALASAAVLVGGLAVEAGHDRSPIDVDPLAGILMFVAVGLGVAAIGAGHRLTRYASLATPIEAVGIVLAGALLYTLGFYRHFVDAFDSNVAWGTASAPWLLVGVPAAIVLGVAAVWLQRSGGRLVRREDWPIGAAAVAALVMVAYVTTVLISPRESDEEEFIIWTVGFWIAELALPAAVIWLGVTTNRSWWTNVALLYLGLFVITRYFDTFGDYTQTGVLFVGAGLLLLVVAFVLERSRRALAELSEREA